MEFTVHDTKNGLALVSTLLAVLAFIPYIRDTLHHKTRPHAFSWLVWGTMSMVAFFAQYSDGGGAGSWTLAFTAAANFIIFFLALNYGEHTISKADWLCLMGAFLGLGLWINEEPPLSLIIIAGADIIGFIPTVRKSLLKPHQETASTYALKSLKYIFAIAALERFTLVTLVFPVTVGAMNAFFVGILLFQRNRLGYGLRGRKKKTSKRRRTKVSGLLQYRVR